jgi:hypothetical protein
MANNQSIKLSKNYSLHVQRLNTLIKYVEKNDNGDGLLLGRGAVLDIVNISEGDSAKKLFEVIKTCSDEYEDRLKVVPEGRGMRYFSLSNIKPETNLIQHESSEIANISIEQVVNDVPSISANETEQKISTPIDGAEELISGLLYQLNGKYILRIKNFLDSSSRGKKRYTTQFSADQLEKLWALQAISYNPDMQRGEKTVVDRNGNVSKVAIYSAKNVETISTLMLKGFYHTDTITLNALDDGIGRLSIINGELYIIDCQNNILDGSHRTRGVNRAKERILDGELIDGKPIEIKLEDILFPIVIDNLPLFEAQEAFAQYANGLKISDSRKQFFGRDSINVLVKEIINNSALKGKVETVNVSIAKTDRENVVTFATLVNAIRKYFNLDDSEENARARTFLPEYFNYLFSIVAEFTDYDLRVESKTHSLLAENFTFYGYVKLAKELMYNDDWEEILPNILNANLEKNSKLWLGTITRKGQKGYSITNNNDTRKKFADAFVQEVLQNKLL